MHRYKIVPPILLILSLINFLLAAPVVVQEAREACVDMAADVPEDVILVSDSEKRTDELEKRWDKYSDEPWQKRGSSLGTNPAPPTDEELAQIPPPSPQTGTTSTIQDAASGSSPPPETNGPGPPSDENYPPSGENHPSDHGYKSFDIYPGSDEDGSGSSKDFSDTSPNTGVNGVGSNDGGLPGSSKSYPPSNRPELASNMDEPWSTESYPPLDGPGPASNGGGPESSMIHPPPNQPEMVSTEPVPEPFQWGQNDWSSSSASTVPEPKESSFIKLFCCHWHDIKFRPRGALNAAQRELQGTTR